MKVFKIISICLLISSFISCSNDNNDNNTTNLMTLHKRITYSPQQENFTNKLVQYYENNQVVLDSTFNGQNEFLSRSTYSYATGSRTRLRYNASNAFIGKNIHNYDNQNRLTSVESYNASNAITYSQTYVYDGENIFAYIFSNGVTNLKYHYKTNAAGYLYYEMDMTNDNIVRTLDYSGNTPTLLTYFPGSTAAYNYHTQIKPDALQNNAIETNNVALASLFMEHVHFSCNYYLKQIDFYVNETPVSLKRDYLFNSNNYETYLKTYMIENNIPVQNYTEVFSYYN